MTQRALFFLALLVCFPLLAGAQIPAAKFFHLDGTELDTLYISPASTESVHELYLGGTSTAKVTLDSLTVLATHPEAFHVQVKKLNGADVVLPDSLYPTERWSVTLTSRSWLTVRGDTCRVLFVNPRISPLSFVVKLTSSSRVNRSDLSERSVLSSELLTILSSRVNLIRVYEISGSLVKTSHGPEIGLQDLAPGAYIARVFFDDDSEQTLRFLH